MASPTRQRRSADHNHWRVAARFWAGRWSMNGRAFFVTRGMAEFRVSPSCRTLRHFIFEKNEAPYSMRKTVKRIRKAEPERALAREN